jgi:hypothetical protein
VAISQKKKKSKKAFTTKNHDNNHDSKEEEKHNGRGAAHYCETKPAKPGIIKTPTDWREKRGGNNIPQRGKRICHQSPPPTPRKGRKRTRNDEE